MPEEDTAPLVSETHDGTEPAAVGSTADKKKKKSSWHELPVLIAVAVGLSILVRMFFVQAFYIPSESMERTLRGCAGCSGNDRVLVWKFGTRFGPPSRGDVVVFDGRGSFVTQDNEKDYIKRVIGLPGDTVMCCDDQGRVMLNDKSINEPYLYEDDHFEFGPVTVPEGELFLMGDHRSASSDSRYNGTVPINRVVGKAFVKVWPPSRIGPLD